MSDNSVGNLADLYHNDSVNTFDLLLFTEDWLKQENFLDTDLNQNGFVRMDDFVIFAQQWNWYE